MTIPVIGCPFCRHFNRVTASGSVCAAFPLGIPDAIAFGKYRYTVPFPCDNGIQFDAIDGPDPDFTELFECLDTLPLCLD